MMGKGRAAMNRKYSEGDKSSSPIKACAFPVVQFKSTSTTKPIKLHERGFKGCVVGLLGTQEEDIVDR